MSLTSNQIEIIKIAGSGVAGAVSYLVGGVDSLLITLLLMMLFDIVSGVLKAIHNRNLDSKEMSKGMFKKMSEILVIVVVNLLTHVFEPLGAARDTVIILYICNEALSILENVGNYVDLPTYIVEFLAQLKDKTQEGKK